MNVKIRYSNPSLHEAAKFIWENNPYVKSWPDEPTSVFDVMDHIKDTINDFVKRKIKRIKDEKLYGVSQDDNFTYVGTGGYYLLISEEKDENDIIFNFEILVDPAVGNPRFYRKEEIVDKIE